MDSPDKLMISGDPKDGQRNLFVKPWHQLSHQHVTINKVF